MVSCCLCGTARTQSNKNSVTFHTFPREAHRRNQWIHFVNKQNWQPSSKSVLCSKHFDEESIDRTSCRTVRLKSNAVPTLNVQRLKYVKTYNTEVITAATSQQSTPKPVALLKPTYLLRLDAANSSQIPVRILRIKPEKLTEISPTTPQTSETKVETIKQEIVKVATSSQQCTPKRVSLLKPTSQLHVSESVTSSYILGISPETAATDTSSTTLQTSENPIPLEVPAQLLRNTDLRDQLESLIKSEKLKSMKIKKLQSENWRLRHRVVHLQSVIKKLQKKNIFEKKLCEVIVNNFGKNKKLNE